MVALNPTHILYPSLYIIQEFLSPWSNPNWYSLLGFPASQQPHSPRFLHVYVCTTYNLVNTSRGKSAWTVMITFLLFPFLWDLCESFIGCFGSYELHFFFSLSASGDCQNILQTPLTLRSHFYTSVYHIVCTNCCLASSPAWLFQALSRSFHVSVGASLVAQTAKNLPAMQVTQVQSLGWEDPLGKEMATHSNILAWRLPWTEESGGLQSIQSKRVRHDWVTNTYLLPCINSSFLSYY